MECVIKVSKPFIVILSVVVIVCLLIFAFVHFKVLKFDNSVSITGIISLFSTIIAFGALLFSYTNAQQSNKNSQKNLEYTRKQLDDTIDRNKKSQAAKVAAWISDFSAKLTDYNSSENTIGSKITIQNASEIPVYKLFIFTGSNRIQQSIGELRINTDELAYIEVLKPGTTKIMLRSSGNAMGGEHESVAMIFDDSQGNTWYRDNYGKLCFITATQLQKVLTNSSVFGPYSQYQPIK